MNHSLDDNQVSQYKELYNFSEKKLDFDSDAILEIAKVAKMQKTGARGLKTIVENVLLDSMFELSDASITVDDVKKVQTQLGNTT